MNGDAQLIKSFITSPEKCLVILDSYRLGDTDLVSRIVELVFCLSMILTVFTGKI